MLPTKQLRLHFWLDTPSSDQPNAERHNYLSVALPRICTTTALAL